MNGLFGGMMRQPMQQARQFPGQAQQPMMGRWGNMPQMAQMQDPYMTRGAVQPLQGKYAMLQGTPWGNYMQDPASFGGQFDNMQTLPWLMNQMRQRWAGR